MKCADVRLQLSAYIDGELNEATAETVRRHVESCEGCAAELRALSATADAARALSGETAPPALADLVMRQIEKEAKPVRVWSPAKVATLAATALVVIGAWAVWREAGDELTGPYLLPAETGADTMDRAAGKGASPAEEKAWAYGELAAEGEEQPPQAADNEVAAIEDFSLQPERKDASEAMARDGEPPQVPPSAPAAPAAPPAADAIATRGHYGVAADEDTALAGAARSRREAEGLAPDGDRAMLLAERETDLSGWADTKERADLSDEYRRSADVAGTGARYFTETGKRGEAAKLGAVLGEADADAALDSLNLWLWEPQAAGEGPSRLLAVHDAPAGPVVCVYNISVDQAGEDCCRMMDEHDNAWYDVDAAALPAVRIAYGSAAYEALVDLLPALRRAVPDGVTDFNLRLPRLLLVIGNDGASDALPDAVSAEIADALSPTAPLAPPPPPSLPETE